MGGGEEEPAGPQSRARKAVSKAKSKQSHRTEGGARTHDHKVKSLALYRLSYPGKTGQSPACVGTTYNLFPYLTGKNTLFPLSQLAEIPTRRVALLWRVIMTLPAAFALVPAVAVMPHWGAVSFACTPPPPLDGPMGGPTP